MRDATLACMERSRVSAILRWNDAGIAREAMRAAVHGGFTLVEFTMTTPGVLDLIAEFSAEEGLLVGAGTVLTRGQAREAVKAGARFLVSPVMDPEIIAEARKLDAVSVPGTSTPTEMVAARDAGADLIKIFPAPADIAGFVRQVLGPLPDLRLFPTAGVDAGNFEAVLNAGAFGVGFVASLFAPDRMAAGDFEAIEAVARDVTGRAAGLRTLPTSAG